MARSTSFQLFKFKNYLNSYHYLLDTRSLNRTSVRCLRGSRFSKDQNQEELKYQKLLRSLKFDSKPLDSVSSSVEAISAELQKNVSESSIGTESDKEYTRISPEDITKKLQEKMIPLKNVAYYRQLERKHKKCCGILRVLGRKLHFLNVPIAMGEDKLPCPVDIVLPSPEQEAYRNQDDFSIGLGLDGSEKTVGFFLDPPTEFSTSFCISPNDLPNLKESHRLFAEDFQTYIRTSPLSASQHHTDKGYWKNLRVRSNVNGDIMGIVVMHPQELSQEELQLEKDNLKDYFSSMPKDRYNLHSLYFQTCAFARCSHEQSPFELIMGEPFIIEEANNMVFHISPDSYFQQNTKAAEVMYNALLKLCRVNKSTTVLDVGCGVGPVSLLFSPKVKKCIGIDDSMQAIIDAKLNAMENRSKNTQFIYGRPEMIFRDVLKSDFHDDLLIVLNSYRSVISKTFILSLREFKQVDKIVYITTKPQASIDNFIQLCRPCGPLKSLGKYFLPIMAVPYDIGPHTEQFGMIIMFQRL